ncbi:hypothetical protein [Pseudomonas sp. NBRC 111135]|uniref:hypothetical protein n=1 Tax=Pseudomonas sp. NBRC 111135 TaxID=1661050 RepID=UPI0006D44257|nr:hypothetical protein [Pseudomonas sp. NBRC 111135]
MSHTPGPWAPDPQATFKIRAPDLDRAIAYLAPTDCDANAKLIAAAPELLAELKNLHRAYVNLLEAGRDRIVALGGDCYPVDRMEQDDPHLRAAKAAIAKATA